MSDKPADLYTYDYNDDDHPAEVLDALGQFYLGGVFTDVSLRGASGRVFQCHRAVLSARSSYFRAMFTADMRERSDGLVTLTGVECDVLAALLRYAYTARVRITEDNVQRLLEAADLMHFASLKRACEAFLVRFLHVANCLGMHAFARLHVCRALEREARRLALAELDDLVRQEEFLELRVDDVRSLLLLLAAENHVDDAWRDEAWTLAVAKWVTHDSERRGVHAGDLLRALRLEPDDVAALRSALTRTRLAVDIKSVVAPALVSRPGKREVKAAAAAGAAGGKKRSPSMYSIGGYYWHPLPEVHIWEPKSDTWAQGKDMPEHARESYSVTLLGADVYVSGGYRTHTVEALDTVSVYNCDRDDWAEGCPMITARYYHCSVTLGGCVYAIGGYSSGAPENQAEYYDPLKKKWFPVAKMIQGVGNASACVVRDRIYVTGGHYGHRGSCTYEQIQVYMVESDEWSIITANPHPEYGLSSVSLNNKMYLVGGQTAVADCYDPETNVWRAMAEMKERRMECGAAVIHGCIYVTGGYSYSKGTYLQSIEKYDPQLDTWEIVGNLPGPARSHGCICVHSVS
ncbi:Kelch-like protein 23 [Merluccius polli]|uniref:Kelch-like protein 23 n=1 Tax=Merluccius polli TaxID=89951 RepID=A0AA47P258_MERPO|nr:Kelch-like protein 23 [Merluccius polli]